MFGLLKKIEKKNIEKAGKTLPEFKAGDTVRVFTKVKEEKSERLQAFEGVCIARKNDSINSSFTVRKISASVGVEKVFPLYGAIVDKIELVKIGKVRRAKLYYLRKLQSKKARIVEDLNATKKAKEKAKVSVPVTHTEDASDTVSAAE
jgi:large subunit ribosomal protein L19